MRIWPSAVLGVVCFVAGVASQMRAVEPKSEATVAAESRLKSEVLVFGQVGHPGSLPLEKSRPLTVIDAISRLGGFSRMAATYHVTVRRYDDKGQAQTFVLDYSKGSAPAGSFAVAPGDILFVPNVADCPE